MARLYSRRPSTPSPTCSVAAKRSRTVNARGQSHTLSRRISEQDSCSRHPSTPSRTCGSAT
eukprot:81862-Prorocentrum_minimum.AAC.1